jgi:hypothetical protein
MVSKNSNLTALVGATAALAILSVWSLIFSPPQAAFAQYPSSPDTGSTGVSNKTLQRCAEMGIQKSECSDQTVLLKERIGAAGSGSGTPMIATGSNQMLIFVGALGSIFGGVAAAFLVQGRRAGQRERQKMSR